MSPRANAFSMHTRVPGPGRMLLPKRFAGMGLLLSIHRKTLIIPVGTIAVRGNKTCVCALHGSSTMRGHFIRLKPRIKGGMMIRENLTRKRGIMIRNFRGLAPKVGMQVDAPRAGMGSAAARAKGASVRVGSGAGKRWRVGIAFFVSEPIFSTMVSVIVIVIKVVNLAVLPMSRCPRVAPPMIGVDTSCPNTDTLAISRTMTAPVRRRVGNAPKVLCVRSGDSGSKNFSTAIAFSMSTSPSLTTIRVRGHIGLTRSHLPTRIVRGNVSMRGRTPDRLVALYLASASPGFSRVCLDGFTAVGILSIVHHVPKMKHISGVNDHCCTVRV